MMSLAERSRAAVRQLQTHLKTLASPSVLLVEHDRDDLFLTKRQLLQHAPLLHITEARTAELAVASVRASHFDLVLLDLQFDGMTGVEVFKLLRSERPLVSVAILTGLADDAGLVKQALETGVEIILRKPISPRALELIFGPIAAHEE